MLFVRLEDWRHVKVTNCYGAADYAHLLEDLADIHFASARIIDIDNLLRPRWLMNG
jgi:hypothetical protein